MGRAATDQFRVLLGLIAVGRGLTDGQQVVHAVGSQIVQIGLPIVLDARVAGDELIAPAGLDGAQVGGLLSVDVGLLSGERYEGLDGQRAVVLRNACCASVYSSN